MTKKNSPKPKAPKKGLGLFGNAARSLESRKSRIDQAVNGTKKKKR